MKAFEANIWIQVLKTSGCLHLKLILLSLDFEEILWVSHCNFLSVRESFEKTIWLDGLDELIYVHGSDVISVEDDLEALNNILLVFG